MGKIAARVARALFGAVSVQLDSTVRGNGSGKRVRALQQERVGYRQEISKAQQKEE